MLFRSRSALAQASLYAYATAKLAARSYSQSEAKVNIPYGPLVRRLLIFNLLLQLLDGFLSYEVLSAGAAEANPFVDAAILNWGALGGLLYHKVIACVLLLLIFAFRNRRQLLTAQALTITASVYTCFGLFCLWELLM